MAAVCYRHLDTSRETEESTKAPNVPSRADAHDKQLGGAAEALPRALQKSSWGGVAVTDKQLGGGGPAEVLPRALQKSSWGGMAVTEIFNLSNEDSEPRSGSVTS